MQKPSEKWNLAPRLQLLQKRIEDLLAQQPRLEPEMAFEAAHEPALVRDLAVGLPEDPVDRAVRVFCRLALMFDAGLMLEIEKDAWAPRALFRQGVARPFRTDRPPLSLPRLAPLQALKTSSVPLLKSLELTSLDPEGRWHAYLVQPTPEFAFILLSGLPDLWLKDHLNRVIAALADSFSA